MDLPSAWHPWTIGLATTAAVAFLGLVVWITRNKALRKVHRFFLIPLVAWTLIGAATVVWSDLAGPFDWGMALGLVGWIALTGYLSAKPKDPGWARMVHAVQGLVAVGWYAVMAHRFGPGGPG